MIYNQKESVEEINEMYGINCSVESSPQLIYYFSLLIKDFTGRRSLLVNMSSKYNLHGVETYGTVQLP
uniref:Ovule protein n=1 Tax=Loa loa TaxID=7209 RepID=A0A1I7VHP2_LOALO